MKYELIDAKQAPKPFKKGTTKRMQQSQELVSQLVPGKVAKVTLGAGDTARGIKTSLTRAADRLGVAVESWDHDGAIYVQLRDRA